MIQYHCDRCSVLHCDNCPKEKPKMVDKDFYTENEVEQMKNFGIKTGELPVNKPKKIESVGYVPGANEKFISPPQPSDQSHERMGVMVLEIKKLKEENAQLKKKALTFDEYSKERILAQGHQNSSRIESFGLAVMGLTGEVGEFAEIIKKHFFHGKELNRVKALTELGDILWYLNWAAHILGSSLEEVAKMNCAKLRQRYPNGFDVNIAKDL